MTSISGLEENADQAAFLRSILESSPQYSIVATDQEGTILVWNEGARRIYGYEPDEVVGKQSAFILHDPEDIKSGRAQQILDETRSAGKWSGEISRVRKDGSLEESLVQEACRRHIARGTFNPLRPK